MSFSYSFIILKFLVAVIAIENRFHFARSTKKSGMLRVSGKDAYKFLQGLVTKDVYKLKDAMYGCFLNTKGRIVADATFIKDRIIEPNDETSILIHTHSSFVESIEKHIKKYRLRSKVDIAHANFAMSQYVSDIAPYQTEKFHCFPDPRHVTFGFNVVQASGYFFFISKC